MKTKTQTEQHTPTPWEVFECESGDTLIRSMVDKTIVVDSEYNGSMVAFSNKANAAFIVRAVNSHDQLLALAKDALEVIIKSDAKEGHLCNQLRAVVAQAEGGRS